MRKRTVAQVQAAATKSRESRRQVLCGNIGAKEGGFTRFAALRGFAAIGLEALARNAVYVRSKLLEHGLHAHAIVVNAAMWSNAGQLFELNDNSGNGQLLGKGYGLQTLVTAESNIISSTTLDAVLQHDINFLKMDVEGCEGRVVAGAKCLLRAHDVRLIFFEFSAKNMQETCRWCRATTTRRFVC